MIIFVFFLVFAFFLVFLLVFLLTFSLPCFLSSSLSFPCSLSLTLPCPCLYQCVCLWHYLYIDSTSSTMFPLLYPIIFFTSAGSNYAHIQYWVFDAPSLSISFSSPFISISQRMSILINFFTSFLLFLFLVFLNLSKYIAHSLLNGTYVRLLF